MTLKLSLVVISEGKSKRQMNLQKRRNLMEATSLMKDETNRQHRDVEAEMAKVKITSEAVVRVIMIIVRPSAMVVHQEVGEASVVVVIVEAETRRMVNNSHVEEAAEMAVNKHKAMKDGEVVKEVLEAQVEAKVVVAIEMTITEMKLIRTMPTRQRIH